MTIVNVDQDSTMNVAYIDKVRAKLPRVEVSLLKKNEVSILVPDSFIRHREDVRKQLRADLRWLDQLAE